MSGTNIGLTERYIVALEHEIFLRRHEPAGTRQTLYFGGGTPSMLNVGLLTRIHRAVAEGFSIPEFSEVTLECNPEDMTESYLTELSRAGIVSRLSVGLQSVDQDVLRWMERRHSGPEAIEAIMRAASLGFNNISADLIFGLPVGGTPALCRTLDALCRLPLSHISAYSLMAEPGSKLTMKHMAVADEGQSSEQYRLICSRLSEAGFIHYEISNWCRPGMESQHNSGYWTGQPYIGLGPAAHSFDGRACRRANTGSTLKYCRAVEQGKQFCTIEQLTQEEQFNEHIMLGLRTNRGVDLSLMLAHGFPEQWVQDFVRTMRRFPHDVSISGHSIRLTESGIYRSDMIMAEGMRVD